MEDWKIAMMVVICVVFVLLAAVLVFLIYRYWNGDRRHAAWCCSDNDDDDGNGSRVGKKGDPLYYPGCTPQRDVLYFLDFAQTLRSVNLKKSSVSSGPSLQRHIARMCGEPESSAETLSLACSYTYAGGSAYAVERINAGSAAVTVELDLDRLVARDAELEQRMAQTAERPLLLHRLVEVGAVGCDSSAAPSAAAAAGPGTASSLANPLSVFGAANNLDVVITQQQQHYQQMDSWRSQQQQQQLVSPAALASNAYSPLAGHPSAESGARLSPQQLQRVGGIAGIFEDPVAPSPLPPVASAPTPLIFPVSTSHITASTPVFIMAAQYFVCLSQDSAAAPAELLDDNAAALLEAAMCGAAGSRVVYLTQGPWRGATLEVSPQTGTASMRLPDHLRAYYAASLGGSTAGTVTVVRRKAEIIRYCFDGSGAAQWMEFLQPIFLPPGRWCLRAKVSSRDERYTATAAKVFSVSVSTVF